MNRIETGKPFFEVFPTLKLKEELKGLFLGVQVMKVATNSMRTFIKVYLKSSHLIQKAYIYEMEHLIKTQLFCQSRVTVQILESFELSGQYTPENIMTEYFESFLIELNDRSVVERSMFQNAKYAFEDENILCLQLTDTIVAQGKKESMAAYLTEVYDKRFGTPIEVRILYKEAKESKLKYNDMKLKQEVDSILSQAKQHKKKMEDTVVKTEGRKKESGERKTFTPRSKGPDSDGLIYGRPFDDETIELVQVAGEMGEITFRGRVLSLDTREIRNEKTIVMYAITDFTDTIMVKMFVRNEQLPDILGEVKEGAFLKIKGVTTIDKFDGELTIGSVFGIKKIPDFTESRKDTAPEKRVELHCHTKMSDMDGVSEVRDIVKRAHDWGHKAVAITDHGVVQSFPDANHYIETLDKEDPFKIIYGVEGYLVDDLQDVAVNGKGQSLDGTYVVFDLETTGFSPIKDKIIEIGAVKVENGVITDNYSTFVNPGVPIPFEITQLTSITDQMVMDSPDIDTILPEFLSFVGDAVLVAHNASFDVGFVEQNCRYQGITPDFTSVDTVALARILLPTLSKFKLNVVAKALNISQEHHHRAVDDARVTAEIYVKFIEMLHEMDIHDLGKLNQFGAHNVEAVRKLPTYHVIILAKNNVGRVNLYTLVSKSHLTYFARRPRIPKSELSKYREGLIVGSACEAGELYQAILNEKSDERIARIVNYYDYLELQPVGNNRFMIDSPRIKIINSEEDIRNINRQIIKLGEKFNKPVVATCDVHFLDPEDEVYRRIIMTGKGFTSTLQRRCFRSLNIWVLPRQKKL